MAASSALIDFEVDHSGDLFELIHAEPALRALARLGRIRLTTDRQFVGFARRFTLADRVVRRRNGYDADAPISPITVLGVDGRFDDPQALTDWFESTGAAVRAPHLDVEPADCPIPLPEQSVVIDLGRHGSDDTWPLTRWIRLVAELTDAGSHVVLIGRGEHRSESREIGASVSTEVTDMVGSLDLAELPAIIARCGRLVSLDEGLQALGRAAGAQVVCPSASDAGSEVFERLSSPAAEPVVVLRDVRPAAVRPADVRPGDVQTVETPLTLM